MQNARADNEKILGLLGLANRAGKIRKGSVPVIEGLARGEVVLVLLSEDAGKVVTEEVNRICSQQGVPCFKVEELTRNDLGCQLGRAEYSVVGLTSVDFTRGIKDNLKLLLPTD